MNLVLQKPGSFCCGQCCVAMVAGLDRKASCKVFGTRGSTTTKSVRRALMKLGYVVNERMKSFRSESALPATCMLTLRFQKEFQHYGHWVVYHNGLIYCPSLGISSYAELAARPEIKSISYLGFTIKTMAKLKVKITADGKKVGHFEISGTLPEQEALSQIMDLVMPDPISALQKLQAAK